MATDTSFGGRSFCPNCGSSIADHSLEDNDIGLYIATFDDRGLVKPRNHIFIEEKIPWVKVDDGLPQYPEMTLNSEYELHGFSIADPLFAEIGGSLWHITGAPKFTLPAAELT